MNRMANSWAARDIASVIHPYTDLARHAEEGPLVIRRGQGVRVEDEDGKWYLEAMSGLWSASLGFSEKRLVEAATRQMNQLPFYHVFAHRSHEPAIELSERLLAMAPAGLARVLFACSGSEANDAAIKLAWYHSNARGKRAKKKIIARFRGYHGVTIATASLTGLPTNHAEFDLPLPGILHTGAPSHYHHAEPGEDPQAFGQRLAAELDALILREGPDTVAAFIAEPVNGGGGVIVPPPGYFDAIQTVLRRHDVLFIVDEVITGFGRTGNMFGCETFGLRPDMMTVAKALSASFAPISALLVSEAIHQSMVEQSRKLGVFGHGHTYAAHPLSAAIARETLRIYEERDILSHVREVAPVLQAGLARLGQHPLAGEARGVGLLGAVELSADPARRTPFDPKLQVGARVQAAALRRGLMVRGLRGDAIAVCPPLIITAAEIEELLGLLEASIDEVAEALASEGTWQRAA